MVDHLPYRILDVAEPVKIKEQLCTVLTVPDIEDAERICLKWHQLEVNNAQHKLKANIHPYSFRKRPTDKLSIHPLFKDRYKPKLIKATKTDQEQPQLQSDHPQGLPLSQEKELPNDAVQANISNGGPDAAKPVNQHEAETQIAS